MPVGESGRQTRIVRPNAGTELYYAKPADDANEAQSSANFVRRQQRFGATRRDRRKRLPKQRRVIPGGSSNLSILSGRDSSHPIWCNNAGPINPAPTRINSSQTQIPSGNIYFPNVNARMSSTNTGMPSCMGGVNCHCLMAASAAKPSSGWVAFSTAGTRTFPAVSMM